MPDPAARPQYTVAAPSPATPITPLNDPSFDTTLMPTNPLVPYVDQAGVGCAEREIFGRPMFTVDNTNTLDNGSDPDNLNFGGFDIAGVGRATASDTSVAAANLYIVIKAEVLDP